MLVIDQRNAQILVVFYVYYIPLHVSSNACSSSVGKIVLYSIWYRRTETSEWYKVTKKGKVIPSQARCGSEGG